MAKSLADRLAEQKANESQAQDIALAITGGTGRSYKAKSGKEIYTVKKSAKLMLFGEQGSGKTHLVIQLLEAGLKVFVVSTDFGGSGMLTVWNWFKKNPDKRHLLDNVVEIQLDATGLMEFVRNPGIVELENGTIYDFNPDVLFWDGVTAYQQVDLESLVSKNDQSYLREGDGWAQWKATQNGTLLPLDSFLKLNGRDGKPWSKVATLLDKKDFEYEKTGETKQTKDGMLEVRKAIIGTNKNGPMLHTGARKISGAGFDLCLETSAKDFAGEKHFYYTSQAYDKMVKSRGFDVPEGEIDVTKDNFWLKYIAPMIAGNKEEERKTNA